MTDHYTPTTDEMRKLYLLKVPHDQRDRRSAEFDRFIATAEQRGAARGWDEAIDYAWDDSSIYEADAKRIKAANPYSTAPTRKEHKVSDLEVEIIRARAHYAANRIIEDGVTFEDSHEDFDELIAQVRKEAKAEALRDAQEIIAGFEHTIDEARERDDMINTGYLIQEIDTEIQDLMEGDE